MQRAGLLRQFFQPRRLIGLKPAEMVHQCARVLINFTVGRLVYPKRLNCRHDDAGATFCVWSRERQRIRHSKDRKIVPKVGGECGTIGMV